MKRKGWLYVSIIISFYLTLFFAVGSSASAQELELEADAAILVEAETGKVVYEEDSHTVLPIASMTKIMTEYLVHEAVNNGEISWEDEVSISDKVRQLSLDTSLSNVPLRQDESYTVEELYKAMAIYSANGATIALAEHIAGSEGAFVTMMNEKAEELGLQDYEFVNSTGLNNRSMDGQHPEGTEADAENLMSAESTALLAYHLLADYPEVLETTSISAETFEAGPEEYIEMQNWNWMLPNGPMPYNGVDGLKTGYTDLAGNAFTGTAERDGLRYISVVMRTDSRQARFEETEKLLDYGFNQFTYEEVLEKGEQVEGNQTLPVLKGKEDEVTVSAGESLSVLVQDGESESVDVNVSLDEELINEEGAIEAPVEAGETVGYVSIAESGDNSYLHDRLGESHRVPLVVDESVERAGWFSLTMSSIGGFFGSLWNSAVNAVKGLF